MAQRKWKGSIFQNEVTVYKDTEVEQSEKDYKQSMSRKFTEQRVRGAS